MILEKYNLSSIFFLIIIGVIVFIANFLDKDLSKVLGIAGFFAWFLREYLKSWLDKDLEQYKCQLQKEGVRFEIQYKKLHAEQAEVIKQFYQRIVKLTQEMNSSIFTLNYKEKGKGEHKYNQIACELKDLRSYYEINTLYFEGDIQKISEKIFSEITDVFLLFGFLKFNQQMARFDDNKPRVERMTRQEFESSKEGLKKDMNENISILKTELEKKFKNIIGIE